VKVRGSARARIGSLLATSTACHLIIFSMLGLIPAPSEVLARHEMEFEVIPPPAKVDVPPPPPPPPPPEEKPKERAKAPKAEAPPPEEAPPPDAPPPPAAEEVADFTGVTLTAEGGGGWSTRVGTGGALKGPVGKIGKNAQDGTQQSAKAAPVGPRVVAVENLSRKPKPPSGMDALLEQNYPPRARMQGVEGKAIMAVRVMPNGRLSQIRVLQEFPAGFEFGERCRRMLETAPAFDPPLDRDGKPVAADIKYTCSYEVGY
jgi:protein TonB